MNGILRAPIAILVLFYQSAILALAQIWANKMRSMLTTLGIVIGVTSVSTIVGALAGLQKTVVDRLESFGTNNMFIYPDRPDTGNKRRLPNNAIFFRPSDFDDILSHCPSLRTIGRATFNRMSVQYEQHTQDGVQISGVEATWHQIEKRPMVQGRQFSELDNDLSRPVCLINTTLQEKLMLPRECVGTIIKVGTSRLLIIGVVEPRPGNLFEGGNNSDCELFMPFRALYNSEASTMNGNLPFMMAQGISKSPELSEEAKGEITFFLRQRRHLKVGEPNTFQVRYVGEFIDQFKQITTAITLVAAGIVGISLVVGGVGIMNIMLVSVSERTREIGLRKAVGAKPSAIMLQFLVEAVFLCLCGGVMGLIFAQGLTVLMARLFALYLKDAYIPGWAIALSFGFCAFVGLTFGMFPAIKAARLDPIEALRHE
jgi:putative ABC transport system permease protein